MRIIILVMLGLLSAISPSKADYYDFTLFDAFGDTGSGLLVTSGPAQIVAVSGTLDGQPITGLSNYAGADNLLFVGTSGLAPGGWSFTLGNGPIQDANIRQYVGVVDGVSGIHVWLDLNPPDILGDGSGARPLSSIDVTAAVPEPSTWAMLLIGFAAIFTSYRIRPAPFPRKQLLRS